MESRVVRMAGPTRLPLKEAEGNGAFQRGVWRNENGAELG